MKYYSTRTKKLYDDEKSLIAAEAELDEAEKAEKRRTEEKQTRYEAVVAAKEAYEELLNAYVKDYGNFYYNKTYSSNDNYTFSGSVLKHFFNFFNF